MSEMVERVARAILAASCNIHVQRGLQSPSWQAWIDERWPEFAPVARAAIEAMREPTMDMVKAQPFATGQIVSRMSAEEIFTAVYRAMIAVAPDQR